MKRAMILAAGIVVSAVASAGPLDGFNSKLTLNLDAVQSNTNTFNLRALVETRRKSDLTTISGRLRYLYAEQRVGGLNDITVDNWLLGGLFEQVIDTTLDWYVSVNLERDRIAELDLRQLYTAGLSYKLRNEENLRWSLRGGVGYIAENFRFDPDTSDIALEFGSDYYNKLSNDWTVSHFFRFVPQPGDFSDYYLQSDLGASYKINSRLDASFRFLLDYDKTPATGFRKDRIQYILGLGYSF